MRFKFLFGHKGPARKFGTGNNRHVGHMSLKALEARHGAISVDAAYSGQDTLIEDFDQGNDDVTAIRSSLGLSDTRRPTSE